MSQMPPITVLDRDWPAYVEALAGHGIVATGTADPQQLAAGTDDLPSPVILLAAPDLAARVIGHLPELRWVQSTWAGVEPIIAAGMPPGITVTRPVGVFGPAMREFVFGHLLAHTQRVHQRIHASGWDPTLPSLLAGSRIGILGTGSIGSALAQAARHFGMRVRGLSRTGRPHPGFERVYPASGRLDFAQGLDHVAAVLPATPATRHLIDGDFLARLRPGATLVNVGRGVTVDTAAVVEALGQGRLALAVLDVLEREPLPAGDPLWHIPNLVLTSHTAAASIPTEITACFVRNLDAWLDDRPLAGVVDLDAGY